MNHGIKLAKARKLYNGFKGYSTLAAVEKQIPEELIPQLTARQLALVMDAINAAYQRGRASTGAEMVDTDCVWINGINRMIEWEEVGAVYERVTEQDGGCKVTKNVKVKDGELVCRFCNQDK